MKSRWAFLAALVCTVAMVGEVWAVDEAVPTPVQVTPVEVSQMSHLPPPEIFPRPDSGASTCQDRSVIAGTSFGPDLVVGHVFSCQVLGHVGPVGSGTTGMSCWTTACTKGDQGTDWWGLPDTNHPMISVNMFRRWKRDGSERLEQIGRGWIKHGFGSENRDDCNFGCTPGHFNLNGPGCSDTYAASQFVACDLGPRSMIHPYTGVMPFSGNLGASGGCFENYSASDHRDHIHDEVSHRVQVSDADLATTNQGARFFSEGQYIVPHEWVDGNGTQNNNVSHRRIQVNGPDGCGNMSFVDVGATKAESPAIDAWTGSAQSLIEPAPLSDGRGFLVHKVTPLGGVWRYEYALYNMNMDLSFGSLSIPLPTGVVVTSVGSHFPLNHAPEPHTENYSNTPWSVSTTGGSITWSTTPFSTDPLANAVRWGSMYNFYFDANTPPAAVSATVGLFKSGATTIAAAQGPSAGPVDCNNNTIEDRCDVDCGLPGCTVPGCGTATDCNANFVPDACEPDCNGNSVADRCDIAASTSVDCDANAVPDECEAFADCNNNSVSDACETYANPVIDSNDDGVPDECALPTRHYWFVDDNAPNDPLPGSTALSDPLENGTQARPFDAMQEAIDAASEGDVVVVRDGTYAGPGNTFLIFLGKALTLRSENGPASTIVDLELFAQFMDLSRGAAPELRIEGFRVANLDFGGGGTLPAVIAGAGASATIADCVFAAGASNNGTIAIRMFTNSSLTISRCRFENVRAAIETFNGNPLIENTVIVGAILGVQVNAGDGTTGCLGSSSARLINCTITGSTTGIAVPGGNSAIIENSVIWGNATQINATPITNATVSYSNIQGGWAGTGNIDADPLFFNAAGGNVRLTNGSPCIDAGDNTASLVSDFDQEGSPRRFDAPTADTGAGSPPLVDMGADEWNDCNGNGTDDSVDVDGAMVVDCDANRIPDSCEAMIDCNTNTTRDACDIALGSSIDCNVNDVPDDCDTGAGGDSEDCNTNAVPDECERDCQYNGVPDECDITLGTSLDCSGNGIPSECEPDCQPNGIADDCDIQSATSADADLNGVPDECEAAPPPDIIWNSDPLYALRATRSVTISAVASVTATGGNSSSAIQVRMIDLQNPLPPNAPCCPPQNFGTFESATCTAAGETGGCNRWVGPVQTFFENTLNPGAGTFRGARLQCSPYYFDWTTEGQFSVFGAELVPSSTYEIRTFNAACKGNEDGCVSVSSPVNIVTRRWGDIAASFDPPGAAAQPDALDVIAAVNKFRNLATATTKRVSLIKGNSADPNVDVDALDIVAVVDAFRGLRFPFSGPCVCPATFQCGATPCTADGQCSGGVCVKTCSGGTNAGLQCITDGACPGGTCGSGACRDRCGRCRP